MIKLSNVNKIYKVKNSKIHAVKDVNLNINEGEIFGIIGYSGAGKSSLIRMLNQLEKPTEGEITIGSKIISSIKGSELRKARQEIGMIFQHFNLLWSRTVKDNIAFPLEIAGVKKQEINRRVDELIKLVGLEGRENSYPSQLSGGQKQRVGIARALANNPRVLLCDEATSALDPETTDQILDLLVDINKKLNLTIALITHEMHVIEKICDRVAVMENGEIVELGSVLEVFKSPKAEITKKFVRQVMDPSENENVIAHLKENHPTGKLIKLKFLNEEVEKPLITTLIRKFNCEINILHGKISQTHIGSYGELFILLNGEENEMQNALNYINEYGAEAEVVIQNGKTIS
ncbi:MAG: methionine transporter ATP-binding protein [Bacillales bacterium]|nr:methionine transporter ATP-binding protein [Bacillales bacterium]